MRENLVLISDNDRFIHGDELGAHFRHAASASVAAEEYDQMRSPWHIQKFHTAYPTPSVSVRVVGVLPNWFQAVASRLVVLSQLGENWDSYGAKPISVRAITSAMQLVSEIMRDDIPVPGIVPTTPGGIQLEWHIVGIDFEVEISPEGNLSVFFEDATGQIEPGEHALPHASIFSVGPISDYLQVIRQRINRK